MMVKKQVGVVQKWAPMKVQQWDSLKGEELVEKWAPMESYSMDSWLDRLAYQMDICISAFSMGIYTLACLCELFLQVCSMDIYMLALTRIGKFDRGRFNGNLQQIIDC